MCWCAINLFYSIYYIFLFLYITASCNTKHMLTFYFWYFYIVYLFQIAQSDIFKNILSMAIARNLWCIHVHVCELKMFLTNWVNSACRSFFKSKSALKKNHLPMRSFLLNLLTFIKSWSTWHFLPKDIEYVLKYLKKKHFKRTQSVLKYILSILKTI